MSDDLSKRGPADRSRINVHEAWELKWWTTELGVTEDTLKNAVKTVGVMVEKVREHLKK
jgi:Protein of unknown function (DUF3606)